MSKEQYPKKCTKCKKPFKPGDKFYYNILDDDCSLDDRCEDCAGNISMMAFGRIPRSTKKPKRKRS